MDGYLLPLVVGVSTIGSSWVDRSDTTIASKALAVCVLIEFFFTGLVSVFLERVADESRREISEIAAKPSSGKSDEVNVGDAVAPSVNVRSRIGSEGVVTAMEAEADESGGLGLNECGVWWWNWYWC